MFELILPKQCTVGHIDIKFSLHPLCTSPPNIHVTLLKQNICSIGNQRSANTHNDSMEVDTKINFSLPTPASAPPASSHVTAEGSEESKQATLNEMDAVLASELLGQGAEVVCGPVDLANFVDMSGHSGVLTLTSPQLFSVKAKSYLLHLKAIVKESSPQQQSATSSKEAEAGTSKKVN